MTPNVHRRRNLRLRGYDYAQAGAYFVTIVTQERRCVFGEVADCDVMLNATGYMVEQEWFALPQRFAAVELDAFVVMPNHLHGIIVLAGCAGDGGRAGTRPAPTDVGGRTALGSVIGAFKSITTHRCVRGVREHGWPPFPARLWQRNYYEHIVRDERELSRLRQYIEDNPASWALDDENPKREAVRTSAAKVSSRTER